MKTVLALSGGLDSTVLLAHLLHRNLPKDVEGIIFTYGAKHNPYENEAAWKIADRYRIKHTQFDLTDIIGQFDSALTNDEESIPEGHYEAKTMERTVVPGRNMIFLSILAGHAWSRGAEQIAIGIHQGDHVIYPDCRPEFYKAMDTAVFLATGNRIEIAAPFVNMDKVGVVKEGQLLNVPFELTRTCYKAQTISCGKCGSCIERLEAFKLNGMKDPISYEEQI